MRASIESEDRGNSMKEQIKYGDDVLEIELPDDIIVDRVAPASHGGAKACHSLRDDHAEDTYEYLYGKIHQALIHASTRIEKCGKIVIACDDNTRVTPVKQLVPPIIDFADARGIPAEIIIAGGSHRKMTRMEREKKFDKAIMDRVEIMDHEWKEEAVFSNVGTIHAGDESIPLLLNRIACNHDSFLMGIGNIVPHSVAGFSGGYKILLPGLSCEETVRWVHYLISKFPSEAILGIADNPVRRTINSVHQHRKIDLLVNTVLDGSSRVVSLCLGNPITAQAQGASISRRVHGVPVNTPGDIVITDSVPESVDFWVVAKAVTNTKAFTRKGGHLIVFGPCDEGLSPMHGDALKRMGYDAPRNIRSRVKGGDIPREFLLEASHACQVGEVMEHCHLHLVASGLDVDAMASIGLHVITPARASSFVRELIEITRNEVTGRKPRVKIIHRGAEILPLQ
ncbi:DUF2088 domain-containing protein [Candidatus Bathyarchaeota archaeon]|nr:DUF2088 domain-containing protein [Candidatus Bathyarchaeota archaeon]